MSKRCIESFLYNITIQVTKSAHRARHEISEVVCSGVPVRLKKRVSFHKLIVEAKEKRLTKVRLTWKAYWQCRHFLIATLELESFQVYSLMHFGLVALSAGINLGVPGT